MSLQDPIADMFCRINNAQARGKARVTMPASRLKVAIAGILEQEGYIEGAKLVEESGKKFLTIELKYYEGRPVIEKLQRISKPGLRRFKPKDDLPKVLGGFGTAIISTSHGLMTDKNARSQGIGGEILCIVT
jgi:small subunit ribosomal protein S8